MLRSLVDGTNMVPTRDKKCQNTGHLNQLNDFLNNFVIHNNTRGDVAKHEKVGAYDINIVNISVSGSLA